MLKKVLNGSLFGAGFALGFILIIWLSTFFMDAFEADLKERSARKSEAARNDPRILKQEAASSIEIMNKGMNMGHAGPELLATVINTTQYEYTWVSLEADLYNEDGEYIYKCDSDITQPFKPGDSKNIKIKCYGINRNIAIQYHSHKISIKSAR